MDRAQPILDENKPSADDLGLAAGLRAECELGLGHVARAVDLGEKAVALIDSGGVEAFLAARSRWLLARALYTAGKDRPRALRLAADARDKYAALGLVYAGDRQKVEAWLARPTVTKANPAPPSTPASAPLYGDPRTRLFQQLVAREQPRIEDVPSTTPPPRPPGRPSPRGA